MNKFTSTEITAQAGSVKLLRHLNFSDSLAVAGLDNQQTGWRIRHPQAAEERWDSLTSYLQSRHQAGMHQFLGAWVGSQRKRPHCAFHRSARSCGYPIRHRFNERWYIIMIYQFLIASPGHKLAELSRIRIVTAFGHTEAEARAHLAGPNLVFLSRTPARKGGAA